VCLLAPLQLSEAFQVRQADSLRVMQSKPYAESANFRVDADMFIQPSARINLDETVTMAPAAPVVVAPTPTPTPAPTRNTGGGSGGGGQRYSADWMLSRKYDQLVKERDEKNGSFLTSAPEDPNSKFDYVPTKPGNIVPAVTPADPAVPEAFPVKKFITTLKAQVLPSKTGVNNEVSDERVVIVERPESLLLSAPAGPNVTIASLSSRQKKTLLKSDESGFGWLWESKQEPTETWQASAPEVKPTGHCIGCSDVLWWSWCGFVAFCLAFILLIVLLILGLQILLLRVKSDRFKPDNPRTLKYRMKKILSHFGLLSLLIIGLNLPLGLAQAVTTTPQLLIYEGELLDDAGVPVVGDYTFRFSFWDNGDFEITDSAGGVLSVGAPDYLGWNEVQTVTTDASGAFSMKLSDVTPFVAGMFDQDTLYLQVEVKVSTDPDTAYEFVDINLSDPLDDRKIIASVPFAFNANKLDYRDLGFGLGNIPYLDDITGLLPEAILPTTSIDDTQVDFGSLTLSDFTNDLALNDGQVFVGNATNVATGVDVTGDATIDNTGAFALAADAVEDDEINYAAVTLADFTNDAGFLTGETQDLTLSGTDLSITGGSTIDLSVLSAAAAITTGVNGNMFTLDLDGDAALSDSITLGFGDTIGETLRWDGGDDRFEFSDDLLVGGNLTTLGTINGVNIGLRSITDVLSPRYPDSIFEADGTNNTGSMFEEEAVTASGILDTVLRWFSRQPVLHDYDTIIQWTVPNDFESFETPALSLDYQTDGLVTDAVIDMTVERNNDGADEITTTGIGLNSNTWTTNTFTLDGTTIWGAGDTMKIRLHMQAKDSNSTRAGNIKINYIKN